MSEKKDTGDVSQTSEQEEQEQIQEFLKEYGELVKKYQIDFAAYPQYHPSETTRGVWETKMVTVPISTKKLSTPSPDEFVSRSHSGDLDIPKS